MIARDSMWPQLPMDGVTELRVHGMGGTPAAEMLDDAEPVQVSGDRVAGVMRSQRPAPDRDWHLEAYSWGGLTGRSVVRTLWLLLLPFSLVNLVGWMTPDRGARLRPGLVRLAGLGLTALYVLFAAQVGMDFVGYQCAAQAQCTVNDWWVIGGLGSAPQRIALGSLLPVLLVVLLWVLGARSRNNYERWDQSSAPRDGSADEQIRAGLTVPSFWSGQAYADRLAAVHVGASFALVAALLGAATHALVGGVAAAAVTALSAAHLAAAVALTLVSRWRARVSPYLARWSGIALVAAGWAAAFAAPPTTQSLGLMPGLLGVFNVVVGVLMAAVVLIAVGDLLPRGPRRRRERVRSSLLAFSTMVLSALLSSVILCGTALFVGDRLGSLVPVRGWGGDGYDPGTVEIVFPRPFVALGGAVVLLPVMLALGALVGIAYSTGRSGTTVRARDERRAAEWAALAAPGPDARHAGRTASPDGPGAGGPGPGTRVAGGKAGRGAGGRLRRWLRRQRSWHGRVGRALWWPPVSLEAILAALYLALPLTAAVAVGYSGVWAVTAALGGDGDYLDSTVGVWNQASVGMGVTVLAFLPVAFMLLLRRGLTQPNTRRLIAILWDILTFWPRSFHPLSPPSYAERAVPEIQTRLERIWTAGGSCVLLGHSQGSVLVAAAVAAMSDEQRLAAGRAGAVPHRLSLVTYGSPLSRLYGQFFPAYFDAEFFAHLRRRLDDGDEVRWRNWFRDTDLVGHEIDAGPGADGLNHYLPDPASPWYFPGDALPPVRGHAHAGYRAQVRFDEHVRAEIARLAARTDG